MIRLNEIEYLIFQFLLQLMVGPNNGKDEITFIQEGLCTLGCPAPLSKSQLKTRMFWELKSLAFASCCFALCSGLLFLL